MPSQDQQESPVKVEEAPPVLPRGPVRWVVPGRCSCSAPKSTVKCVLLGDGGVGKSSLIVSYTTNGYPMEHVPTAIDYFTARVRVDGRPVQLQICDIAGQKWETEYESLNDTFEHLRRLCYSDADVFLLCYSAIVPSSFHSVRGRWAPEVRRLCPAVPVILVGTQADLREDVQVLIRLAQQQERPVSEDEAWLCAQDLHTAAFYECSALTQKNLKAVFDSAIMVSLERVTGTRRLGLREKTPNEIRELSKTWWRKHSCFM